MKIILKKRYIFLLVLFLIIVEIFREMSYDPQDFSDSAKRIVGNIWLEPYHDNWGPTKDSLIFTSQNGNRIPSNILEYHHDDTIIVVKQKEISNYGLNFPSEIVREYPYSEDSIFYWMIFVPVDSFIGPLTHDSISILYDNYNIDESLRL